MRPCIAAATALAFALAASPALADEPDEAPAAPTPAPETPKDSGVRLGLDLAYERATSSEDVGDFANRSPARVPLGLDLSFRKSATTLMGFHAHAGMASRTDCGSEGSCFARTYGGGVHFEWLFREGTSFVPWLRYGFGVEALYRSGGSLGEATRWGVDVADLRLGGDFVAARYADGRTMRVGPFVGFDGGLFLLEKGLATRGEGTTFAILSLGVRGTLEP